MPTSLIIVDDSLSTRDAQGLREVGLQLTYPEQQGAFPGRNSLERIEMDGLDRTISNLVGERVRPVSPLQSHAKFRITLASDKARAKVHIDQAYWSAILYLSRPEDCRGGTEFFRHLPTNTERAPWSQEEARERGYDSLEHMYSEIIEKDSNDDGKWERTMTAPMRFNRLVLLRPWLWHTAGQAFGDRMENGRLVYLMFFAAA